MTRSRNELPLNQLKVCDLVSYLSELGFSPSKIRNHDYWYLSPLRFEKTPSFKINRKINRWFDHGMGKGGNFIDFALLFHNCSIKDLHGKIQIKQSEDRAYLDQPGEHEPENKMKILDDYPLKSVPLLNYLQQRRIPLDIASKYCREVNYELNNKMYFGIGFKNNSGGFELRNRYAKLSSSPKDITTFNNAAKEVAVFEGFFDFLSFLTINRSQEQGNFNFLILNSVSFFQKAKSFMEEHEAVRLFLDRDQTGQNYSRFALSLGPKYRDESILYKDYKDLNDWHLNMGKSQKKIKGHRL